MIFTKKKAFTLVELIVVITILSILGTIGFISMQSYGRFTRNSVRISDMKTIEKSLSIFKTSEWYFPSPDNARLITYSWAGLFTQWVFWNLAAGIARVNPAPVDPQSNMLYGYSLANNGNEYQIAWIFEEELASNIVKNTYAVERKGYVKLAGNYNKKILFVQTWGVDYIIASPSLFRSSSGETDIISIFQNRNIVAHSENNLPEHYSGYSWQDTYTNMTGSVTFWISMNPVVYSGSVENLIYENQRLVFAKNLEQIYKNSTIQSEFYHEILDLDATARPSEAKEYIATLVASETAGMFVEDYNTRIQRSTIDWVNYFKSTDDSINSNLLLGITQDPGKWIWFATNGWGASYYDTQNDTWTNYTITNTNNKLLNNTVNSIFVDASGKVWFSTNSGLAVLSGSTWSTHTSTSSNNTIPGNTVRKVIQDTSGNIWAATSTGIWKYDGNTWTRYTTTLNTNGELPGNNIYSLMFDSSQNLWATVYGAGVVMYNGTTWRVHNSSNSSGGIGTDNTYEIAEDTEGYIWITTNNAGVSRYDKNLNRWVKYMNAPYLSNNRVYYSKKDSQGNIWFGNSGWISKYTPNSWTGTWTRLTPNLASVDIRSIEEDSSGNMWFGSATWGATKYNGSSWTAFLKSSQMLSNSILSATSKLAEQIILIGTSDMGGNLFNGDTTWINYDTSVTNIGSNNIRDTYIDQSWNFWFATSSWLNRKSMSSNAWSRYLTSQWLWHNSINKIFQDSSGILWIATASGLSKQNAVWTYTWTNYTTSNWLINNTVYDITQDNSGNIWIATNGGISKFDGSSFVNYTTSNVSQIPSNTVNAIAKDGDGNIWIGTSSGLVRYNTSTQTWDRISQTNGLSHNNVRSLAADASGNIWIGTQSGLNKYNASTNSFSVYTTADGLINNYINEVSFEGNIMWVSTNGGLSKGTIK